MEVILTQPVRNLGETDDLVKVKDGYGRNYLLPQGLAIMATQGNRKAVEEKKRQAAHKQDRLRSQAQEIADRLANHKLVIETLAGADGKLFGAVTTIMVANKLNDAGFDLDRRNIVIGDIRHTGEFTAQIHLHREVKASVAIEVVRKAD